MAEKKKNTKRISKEAKGQLDALNELASQAEFADRLATEEKLHSPPRRLGILESEPEQELGDRLQRAREAKGLTQGQLADLTKRADKDEKGLSRAVISLYEAGTNRPGPRELRLLCEVLRVTPSYFIYGIDDPFDTFLDRYRYGVIGGSNPEVVAALIYCFKRLHPHHRMAIMELMLGLLRGWNKGFDDDMDREANQALLETAEELRLILFARKEQEQGE